MSTDPYAAPTDEEWAEIEKRFQEAERVWRSATDEYHAAFETWRKVFEQWETELDEWKRAHVLRHPVREYVIKELSTIIYRRPPSAKKIDPYHRPSDVGQVLDELIAEGKVRRAGRGYEWVADHER
jgi:hypothetical protein